jgi:Integrase zinc binding domain
LNEEYTTFVQYCTEFFIDSGKLWRKDSHGAHKIVPTPEFHLEIICTAHDNISHKMIFPTKLLIALCFWWPNMKANIAWFIRTCHYCQLRQTQNLLIPPTVATPAPLFAKIYINTMHMPASGGYQYIVQGQCSITYYPKF